MTRRPDPHRKELVDLLLASSPMKEPFQMCPWLFVSDPVRFHQTLVDEVNLGPESPRARTGALFQEIELYLKAKR